jgi:hypothetical protein
VLYDGGPSKGAGMSEENGKLISIEMSLEEADALVFMIGNYIYHYTESDVYEGDPLIQSMFMKLVETVNKFDWLDEAS